MCFSTMHPTWKVDFNSLSADVETQMLLFHQKNVKKE